MGATWLTTSTVTVALPVLPLESVAVQVMVWVPAVASPVRTVAPMPICPSRLLVHTMLALDTVAPVGGVTVAVKLMASPMAAWWPAFGEVMVTWGTSAAVRVSLMLAEAEWPALSVAVRVMVWAPTVVRAVVTVAPRPRAPSLSLVQDRALPVRVPSTGSVAEPVKVMEVPAA